MANTATRDQAQRLSAAQLAAAIEVAAAAQPAQEVSMSTATSSIPLDLMTELRNALASQKIAPAVVDGTDNTAAARTTAMPKPMADKWAELRQHPDWNKLVRYNANGVPLNRWGAFLKGMDKSKANLIVDASAPLAAARPKAQPQPAAAASSDLRADLLNALQALLQPAAPAPAPAASPKTATTPKAEPRRMTIENFMQLHPQVVADLQAAIRGSVMTQGGNWAAFRIGVLGR